MRSELGETDAVVSHDDRQLRVLDRLMVLLLLSLASALGFLALNRPWVSDDFYNAVVLRQHPGLWDYVSHWYSGWSGRFSASAFSWVAQQTRPGHGILTWIGLLLLVVMTFAVARARLPRTTRADLQVLSVLSVAYWYGLPAIQESVFWASGSTAYLWPAVFGLFFVYQYRRWDAGTASATPRGLRGVPGVAGMLLLGVWVGGFQEQVLVACILLLALLGVRIVRSHQIARVPARLCAGALGLLAGGAMSLGAPGNGVRLDAVPDAGLWETVVGALKFVVHLTVEWLPPLVPWLLCLLLLAVPIVRSRTDQGGRVVSDGSVRSDWWVWLLLGLATITPFLVRPFFGAERTSLFIAVFLAVAALSLGNGEQKSLIDRLPASTAVAVMCVVLFVTTASVGLSGWQAYTLTRGQKERAGLVVQAKREGVLDVVVPAITDETPRRGVIWGDGSPDAGFYVNQLMASYYGVNTITVTDTPEAPTGSVR